MPIYLDHAATTPPDERVVDVVCRTLRETAGNASSHHRAGVAAAAVVERTRLAVAAALGAHPDEVLFTGGGTEANNLALQGVARARREGGGHVVTSTIEHASVREVARFLTSVGLTWTAVGVDREGYLDPAAVAAAIRPDTVLVSVVHGNNEIGTVQPLAAIARVCHERGVPLHTDACQSFTRAPLRMDADGPDLVSVNAHKLRGPKGVGALVVRRGLVLAPLVLGGGQERGLRSGTLDVPGIAGFGAALALSEADGHAAVAALRDRFVAAVREGIPGVRVNGPLAPGLPHIASLTIHGVPAKRLVQALSQRDIFLSTGSACASGRPEPSPVLLAIGLAPDAVEETVRASFGHGLTAADVDAAAAALCEVAPMLAS